MGEWDLPQQRLARALAHRRRRSKVHAIIN